MTIDRKPRKRARARPHAVPVIAAGEVIAAHARRKTATAAHVPVIAAGDPCPKAPTTAATTPVVRPRGIVARAVRRLPLPARVRVEVETLAPRLIGTLGTSGVVTLLGLLSGTVAARALGASGRGDLAQLLLWPQLVVALGNMSVEIAATYFSSDPERGKDVPATTLAIAAAQSVVLLPLYLLLVPLVFSASDLRREAYFMAPLIPLYLAGAVSIDCLAGRLRFGAFNAVRFALPLAYCGAIVTLTLLGILTPLSGAAAFVAAHAVADSLAVYLVWRGGGFGSFDRRLAGDVVRFGLRSHAGRLSPQALGVDTAIIALMLSSRDLGLYSAATAFIAAPNLVASSIGMVVFPHVSATHQAGQRLQVGATFALHAAMVIVLAAVLFVFAAPIITLLFGDSYRDAAPALRFLALGSVAYSIRAFPIEVLRGIGRPGLTSIAEAANAVIFLCAIPLGALAGGFTGTAAAVAAASYASLAVLAVIVLRTGVLAGEEPTGGAAGTATHVVAIDTAPI